MGVKTWLAKSTREDSDMRAVGSETLTIEYISSFALLKVNWDREQDYIDNFVPFIAECLRRSSDANVKLVKLQTLVRERFGFKIPQAALRTILRRARRRGYVDYRGGGYVADKRRLAGLKFDSSRKTALRQTRALVAKLRGFFLSHLEIHLSEEEAESALFDYMKEHSSVALGKTAKPEAQESSGDEALALRRHLVNSFVIHLQDRDEEGYRYLETVVMGSTLANTLFFPSLGKVKQKLVKVRVFLDTGVLLPALGVGDQVQPYLEMLDLTREVGGRLCCFEHTVEEALRVLAFLRNHIRDSDPEVYRTHDLLQQCVAAGASPGDIEKIIGRFDATLEKLRISVIGKPAQTRDLSVDERTLEYTLQKRHYRQTEQARLHDVESLTAIHRLRGGRRLREVERCRAIFITSSSSLARISAGFFGEHFGTTTAPHCMHAQLFTTIVWLKKPLRIPDLPMRKLIADCYAALQPSEEVWARYLAELDEIESRGDLTSDDLVHLRHSVPARNELLNVTFNKVERFDENTVPKIIEKVHAAARADTEVELERERSRRREAELSSERSRKDLARISRDVELAQTQAKEARDLAAEKELELERSLSQRENRLQKLSGKISRAASLVLLYLSTGLTGVMVYVTRPGSLDDIEAKWYELFQPLVALALFVCGVLTVLNLSFGTNLRSLARRFEGAMERRVYLVLSRWLLG